MKSFVYELLNKLDMGILIIDEDLRIVHINHWLSKRIELETTKVVNCTISQIAPRFNNSRYQSILREVLETGRGRFLSGAIHKAFFLPLDELEATYALQNLQIERLCIQGKPVLMIQIKDVSKETYKVTQMKRFIKKLEIENDLIRKSEEKNRQLALYDSLSGIPNRAFFISEIAERLQFAIEKKQPLGLLFIDLDRLKMINDTYGHRTGDEVIVEFAKRLKANSASEDFVARLSGDEFAILVSNYPNAKTVDRLAQSIIEAMRKPLEANGKVLQITCSMGISLFKHHTDTQETLIERADKALYYAKNNGRNQYHFYKKFIETS